MDERPPPLLPKLDKNITQTIADDHLSSLQAVHQLWEHVKQIFRDSYAAKHNDQKSLHSFQPGDLVYLKKLPSLSLEPRWTRPWTVILTTLTALKVAGKITWIHWTHVKPAPASRPEQQTEKWTVWQTNDLLKIRLFRN